MRSSNTKTILTACEMSFAGKTDTEIAADLETSVFKCITLAEE